MSGWFFSRDTVGKNAVAGAVLGVESVPDGLAAGLLAGINPLHGLYRGLDVGDADRPICGAGHAGHPAGDASVRLVCPGPRTRSTRVDG